MDSTSDNICNNPDGNNICCGHDDRVYSYDGARICGHCDDSIGAHYILLMLLFRHRTEQLCNRLAIIVV